VSSVLSHWVLPLFAVASAPFETCLLESFGIKEEKRDAFVFPSMAFRMPTTAVRPKSKPHLPHRMSADTRPPIRRPPALASKSQSIVRTRTPEHAERSETPASASQTPKYIHALVFRSTRETGWLKNECVGRLDRRVVVLESIC
jgi:hypothetical protein